jgi:hypothetical protein
MKVKLINRTSSEHSPQYKCLRFAEENGFELRREPFGKRGSLIEIYRNGECLDYRKSYASALAFMKKNFCSECASQPRGA